MDNIFSLLPLIFVVLVIVSKLGKAAPRTGATRPNQPPRNPNVPLPSWAQNLDTALQKFLAFENPTPAPVPERVGIQRNYEMDDDFGMENTPSDEGTAGVEGIAGDEGTQGVEGTFGTEGTFNRTLAPDIGTPQSEDYSRFPDLTEKNLQEAVIWAEVLGKPRARMNRYYPRYR